MEVTYENMKALEEENAILRGDLEAAAGELLLPMPEPGTDMARLMSANRILRGTVSDLEAELARYRETIGSFISTVLTINQRENLPEWMEYLAERINEVCEVIGEGDRVTYNPKREVIYITRKG